MAENNPGSKGCNIDCIEQWARALQFVGALLLIVLAITRFFGAALSNPPAFILTLYYPLFSGIILMSEFQWKFVMSQFYFLYYAWGKAVLDFFLFTM